jgi:molybdenum-dependent DNA-binding transcriptional regulator ModE
MAISRSDLNEKILIGIKSHQSLNGAAKYAGVSVSTLRSRITSLENNCHGKLVVLTNTNGVYKTRLTKRGEAFLAVLGMSDEQ